MKKMIFETRGNVELLSANRFALFASQSTTNDLIHHSKEVFSALKQSPFCAVGGWQAKAEKQILSFLNKKTNAAIIHYLAKDLNRFIPNASQQNYLEENRLLFVAPPLNRPRPSRKEITLRDQLLFSQTRKIFFLYVRPGGRLETYLKFLNVNDYTLFILDHPKNKPFFDSGLIKINPDNAELLLS